MNKRNTIISICKAFAIILMVIGHADSPAKLQAFLYEFHMPIFFICAGYFFSLKYLNNEATFIKKRVKGLYIPFVKWSIFFLIIHNLMFKIGILNETYGNWSGGVTHPYSWHQIQQNLWNIFTCMGGYDVFLAGAFWFFRALFVASILYLILYKIMYHIASKYKLSVKYIPFAICLFMLLIAAWKTGQGLAVINLVQGGYRDIMGTFFFGFGFIFNRYHLKIKQNLWLTTLYFIIVLFFSIFATANMDWKSSFNKFLYLPIPAIAGFLMVYNISTCIDKYNNTLKKFLVYCGDNTLPIYVFHIISFKVVSLIKIWYYDLDYKQIGCHMVIHEHANEDYFWILYTIAGVGIPLLWKYYYHKLAIVVSAKRTTSI